METQVSFRGNTAYWKNVKLGTIYPSESVFRTVKKTQKNILRVLGGIGINEHLLILLRDLNVIYLEVPFENQILKTTVNEWLRCGIRSPFCSPKVDQQVIMRVERITLDSIKTNSQPSLFECA